MFIRSIALPKGQRGTQGGNRRSIQGGAQQLQILQEQSARIRLASVWQVLQRAMC